MKEKGNVNDKNGDLLDLTPVAQQGGFALLAAVCVWAIVAVVKIGVAQMERSHTREIETLRTLAQDRSEMLKAYTDVMMEVRSSLIGLQDEISQLVTLRRKSDRE